VSNKWLPALVSVLLATIFRRLIGWDPSTHYLPETQGWFFLLSESSPLYLLLFVVGLMVVRRKEIADALKSDGDNGLGLMFMLPGMVLFAWGHYVNALDILFFAFLCVIMGTAGFLSGKRLVSELLLPVLILALTVPPPAVLINQIVFPFQLWTADHVAWLLYQAGLPALARGDYIILDGWHFQVAETCTALGFIKWLVIFAMAYVYLFPVSRLHSFLLISIAPFIAYGVNLFRAISLVMSPGIEVLSLHTFQGIAFFLAAFVLMHLISGFLARMVRYYSKAGAGNRYDTNAGIARKWPASRLLIPSLAILLSISILLPPWSLPAQDTVTGINLSGTIGNWKYVHDNHKSPLLGTVQYTQLVHRDYVHDGATVSVLIGTDDRKNRVYSFLSPKNIYPDAIGLSDTRGTVDLGFAGRHATSLLSVYEDRSILSYLWYENVNGLLDEIVRACLALDQSPFRRPGYGVLIRVDTPVEPTPRGRVYADARLRDFVSHMDMTEIRNAARK
jgi:exosortase